MSDAQGERRTVPRRIKPAAAATPEARRLLGRLLEERRGELGFAYRTTFAESRSLSWRLVTDIESAYRASFTNTTLARLAQGYGVTIESVLAVLAGQADHLDPLPSSRRPGRRAAPSLPAVPEWLPPDVSAAARPLPAGVLPPAPGEEEPASPVERHVAEIMTRVVAAAARTGTEDPPPPEVFADPADQLAWHTYRRRDVYRRARILAGMLAERELADAAERAARREREEREREERERRARRSGRPVPG